MQACEDVLKNLVFLTLSVREEEREVGKEGKQERVKWKRREGEMGEVGKKGEKREKGGSLISFIYLGLMSFIPLKKLRFSSTSPKTKNPMKMSIPAAMVPP